MSDPDRSSMAAVESNSPAVLEGELWLLRLHNNLLSWHSYKSEDAREKWAQRYRERGDRVSFDGFIRG